MWIVISRTIKQLQNYEVVRGRRGQMKIPDKKIPAAYVQWSRN